MRISLAPSSAFTGLVQLVTTGLAIGAPFTSASIIWWLLAFLGYTLHAGVGLSIGYHRYFAHRTFTAPRWAELLFALSGALGGVGSAIAWVSVHRAHHTHSDTHDDPHAGGWKRLFLGAYARASDRRGSIRDLLKDPVLRFIHRYYVGIVIVYAMLLLALNPRALLFAWAIPVASTLWLSGLSLHIAHSRAHGDQPAATPDDSVNIRWLAFITWGEGLHNNHHANPAAAVFGRSLTEPDLGALLLPLFKTHDAPPSKLGRLLRHRVSF